MSIVKLIHLIDQMSDRGLWLTYRKSDQANDSIMVTTPRGRGEYHPTSSTKHIFLRRKGNPLAQSAGPKMHSNFTPAKQTHPFEAASELNASYLEHKRNISEDRYSRG